MFPLSELALCYKHKPQYVSFQKFYWEDDHFIRAELKSKLGRLMFSFSIVTTF